MLSFWSERASHPSNYPNILLAVEFRVLSLVDTGCQAKYPSDTGCHNGGTVELFVVVGPVKGGLH